LAVLYKSMDRLQQTESGQSVLDESDQPRSAHFGLIKMHHLCSIEQTEGRNALKKALLETEPTDSFLANSIAENLLLSRVHVSFIDLPTMPLPSDQGSHPTAEKRAAPRLRWLLATALHDLTHWTGYHARFQREGVMSTCTCGSPG